MGDVVALALKDLRLLWRDKAGLFWVIFFPLLMAIFFGAIFGGGGGRGQSAMPIAVVDEDESDASRAYVERLGKSEALNVEILPRGEALAGVRKGRLVAYVALEDGFGESGGMPFGGGAGALEVGIDPSRKAEAGYLEGILMQATFDGLMERFSDPRSLRQPVDEALGSLDSASTLPDSQRRILRDFLGSLDTFLGDVDTAVYRQGPLSAGPKIDFVSIAEEGSGPRSSFEISFAQAIAWALIGTVAAFAMSLVKERVDGTFLRLRLAPLTRGKILAGKGLACCAACLASATALLLVGAVVFGVRLSNPAGILLAAVSISLAFTGIMMLIATLGKTEQSVAGAGWAILLVFAMLGGGMVPLIAMPQWMRTVSNVSPVKWTILAMEGGIWRGFSLAEILPICGLLVVVGVLFFALGVKNLARTET